MTSAPRFYQSGGQLFADRRPVSLEWAQRKWVEWLNRAKDEARAKNFRLANEYQRQADAIGIATQEAERWLRASGPNAAEAYTNKVREMLAASLESGR